MSPAGGADTRIPTAVSPAGGADTDLQCHWGVDTGTECHRVVDTHARNVTGGWAHMQGMSPGGMDADPRCHRRGWTRTPGAGAAAAPPRGAGRALLSPRSRCHSGATCARPARRCAVCVRPNARRRRSAPPAVFPNAACASGAECASRGGGVAAPPARGGAILEAALRTLRSGRAVRLQGQHRLPARRCYAVCVASPKMAARSSSAVAGARAVAAARPGARAGVRRAKGGSA